MPSTAKRLNNLSPYVFSVIGDQITKLRSRGVDVIRLDIGSPDLPPPDFVIAALSRSAQNPHNHEYAGYRGTPSFRASVAHYYEKRFGVALDPDTEVLPLLGSKEGIVNLSMAYLDKGDISLIPSISYPSYAQGARLAGGEIYWVPAEETANYLPSLDTIPSEVLGRAKLFWVNYPNNPTGAVADLEFYARLAEFCREHDILLASDNPYVDLTFDQYRAVSALQVPGAKETTVEFMSLSKTFNMGGWRIAAAVGSATALRNLLQVKSNMDSGHFIPIYDAGAAALQGTPQEWIDWRNNVYRRRRDRILEILPYIGLQAEKSRGSLYIWAKVADGDGTSYVAEALNGACVSLAPGEAYGPGGKPFVRISLGVADDRLEVALEQLQRWYA